MRPIHGQMTGKNGKLRARHLSSFLCYSIVASAPAPGLGAQRSLGDEKCEFRPVVLKALNGAGRDWRPVCEVSSMEPLLASIVADLAIAPLLRTTIPHYLQAIERDRGLPRLPKFFINMYLPPARQSETAVELARHIAQEFEANAYGSSRRTSRIGSAAGRFRSRQGVAPGGMGVTRFPTRVKSM
jgi:DNA-binding transcriptional LysR family regulator